MTELDQPTPEGTDSHYKATGSAVVRETHSAYVFLLDTVAYKKKKSVRTDFLDFSSVDSRWSALDREYTLNCRFAPDVYLGIAELTDPAGGPAEPLLKMRRLPDSAKLSTLAAAGTDLTDYLSDIARIVASVHLHSPRNETISHEGTREALRGRWHANLHELRALSPGIIDDTVVDAIEVRSGRYIDGRGALFDARIATGHVVDGHGDLLADDIFCMPDGPRILDCLDFDDSLRYLDGIDDAACLAMDLEYHHRPDAAHTFLDAYLEAACDAPPASLVDHYIAYRATMRAKVACIRALQGCSESKADASDHAQLALKHLEAATVTLTLIGGLPGTGKSTLATALADKVAAVVLSSDIVRKELAGFEPSDPHPAAVGQGLYTPSMTDHAYAELLQRARTELAAGRSVIVDASWSDPSMRERARLVAAMSCAELVELECSAPTATSLHRIESRKSHVSDATREVYDAMARTRKAWPTAAGIDCSHTVTESVEAAYAQWRSVVRGPLSLEEGASEEGAQPRTTPSTMESAVH